MKNYAKIFVVLFVVCSGLAVADDFRDSISLLVHGRLSFCSQ